jgi:cytidylate kinase
MRIAIDGPAGAGKSTVAEAVASMLGLRRVDTGAMYRALTVLALERGVDLRDGEALARLLAATPFTVDGSRVCAAGRWLDDELRTPEVDAKVSVVAAHAAVRSLMVERQRALSAGGAVVDGRDIGTHVLPDAELKIFLTASAAARARRRARQLAARGFPHELPAIEREIEERDARDRSRPVNPLRPAPDAVVIDTTDQTVEEVAERIVALARMREP